MDKETKRAYHSKTVYNLKRIDLSKYDFFTIGYSRTSIEQFIEKLNIAGVKTVVDVRKNPQSRFKVEFNKKNIEIVLKHNQIKYLHCPDLGVPSEMRQELNDSKQYDSLWKWYDKNVIPKLKMQFDDL
jgi:uncharacterized protein (DUF488 family)